MQIIYEPWGIGRIGPIVKRYHWLGGTHRTMDNVLASHPAALGSILSIPINVFLDVADMYLRHCLVQLTEA